jgi:mannose-6-phosphate isomerase-like protein (cupin superfamily)
VVPTAGFIMSRLARRKYSAELNMPDFKVMGTLNDVSSKQLTKMVINKDTSDNDKIVSAIVTLLGSQIKNVKADRLDAPVESKYQISTNYNTDNPVGVFYIISEGTLTLEVGKDKIKMQPNKVYFVNDRNAYRVLKEDKTRTVVLSGIFAWDKDKHGG